MIGIGLGFVSGSATVTARRDKIIKGDTITLSDTIIKMFDGVFIRNSITLSDAIASIMKIAHQKSTSNDSVSLTDGITIDLAIA